MRDLLDAEAYQQDPRRQVGNRLAVSQAAAPLLASCRFLRHAAAVSVRCCVLPGQERQDGAACPLVAVVEGAAASAARRSHQNRRKPLLTRNPE
jgi:aminoglycoside phosphotransferase